MTEHILFYAYEFNVKRTICNIELYNIYICNIQEMMQEGGGRGVVVHGVFGRATWLVYLDGVWDGGSSESLCKEEAEACFIFP